MVIIGALFAAIGAMFAWLKKKDNDYKKVVEERIKREESFHEILEEWNDTRRIELGGFDGQNDPKDA